MSERGSQVTTDAVPEPPDEATTKPGELWQLGDHRLLCGDSEIEKRLRDLEERLIVDSGTF